MWKQTKCEKCGQCGVEAVCDFCGAPSDIRVTLPSTFKDATAGELAAGITDVALCPECWGRIKAAIDGVWTERKEQGRDVE